MRGAGADLHVIGLQQGAALVSPVRLELENDLLESEHGNLGSWGKALGAPTLSFYAAHLGWTGCAPAG